MGIAEIILWAFAALIILAIAAVNIWQRRLTHEERKRLDAESAEDMRNFSM
jgi:cytochrome c-type biogenesis protein CcmH/NrfF